MPFKKTEDRKKHMRKRWLARKALVDRWKRYKGCSKCGYNSHSAALQLHHTKPLASHKAPRIGDYYQSSKETFKKQLAKVEVLCSNCHAIESWS